MNNVRITSLSQPHEHEPEDGTTLRPSSGSGSVYDLLFAMVAPVVEAASREVGKC